MAAFGQVVAEACSRVYTVLDRLWCEREAVKDRWIARIYGPPTVVNPPAGTAFLAAGLSGHPQPKPRVPTYDGRDARAELAAASAAAAVAGRIEADFAVAVRDAVNNADAAASRGDSESMSVAEAVVRRAADDAIAALLAEPQ